MIILSGIFFQKLKGHRFLRILVLAIMLVGMFFLLFPDSSTWIAAYLGIGRGVDLLIYLGLFVLTLVSILLYLKILGLQKRIEVLVREAALREGRRDLEENK